jgi:Ca2+-binding RTX toxin-like protein
MKRVRSVGLLRLLAATAVLVLASSVAVAFAANLSGDGTIVGTTGNDNIKAGDAQDTIWGLGGSDNITAGTGQDVVDAGGKCQAGVKSGVYPNGLPSSSYCQHGPGGTCGTDNIKASSGQDVVWGNCGPNNITLGGGQDTVYGYGGPNVIKVGNGQDTIYLYDTAGASSVNTGTGQDIVYAQNGVVDTINCGSTATTVYADRNDKTSNCTVKYTKPSRDVAKRASKRRSGRARKATSHAS